MGRRIVVDLFCEDSGHESFARALLKRLEAEVGIVLKVRARSARGGHGRAISELCAWQRAALDERGDILLVMIDANAVGWHQQRADVAAAVDASAFPETAIGCPDPHTEAWCAADPGALETALGARVPPPPKSGRGSYKRWLRTALEEAGVEVFNDPMDISDELVPEMDLYHAGRNCPSLKHFTDEVRAALLRVSGMNRP